MKYPHVTEIEDWPIYKAGKNRDEIKELVVKNAHHNLNEAFDDRSAVRELLERTIYSENYRIKNEPWDVDPKGDEKYWKKVGKQIYKSDPILMNEAKGKYIEQQLLYGVISRYADEILGKFNPTFYKATVKTAPFLFSRLLNTTAEDFGNLIFPKTLMSDKVLNIGPIEKIRSLSTKGTLIMLPTHFSNLDSMMIGYGIANMGLPPFQYAAGLNLFNSKVFGYFMERLGAYKLDRRKKNPIYLETLKSFSRVNLMQGVHTLFFPGGTRSRSGAIESRLKLGLMGTIVEAQREHCAAKPDDPEKIFILPLSISYHFVLEATSLIEEYLKKTGKSHYITIDDEFSDFNRVVQFLWNVYRESSEISLSFGDPVDVFGNHVDFDGNSYDGRGNKINISRFFMSRGKVEKDLQREQEFTRLMGERVLKACLKINVVYASHLVAFVAFQIFIKDHPNTELYSLLKIPPQNLEIEFERFRKNVDEIVAVLRDKAVKNELILARHFNNSTDSIIESPKLASGSIIDILSFSLSNSNK